MCGCNKIVNDTNCSFDDSVSCIECLGYVLLSKNEVVDKSHYVHILYRYTTSSVSENNRTWPYINIWHTLSIALTNIYTQHNAKSNEYLSLFTYPMKIEIYLDKVSNVSS